MSLPTTKATTTTTTHAVVQAVETYIQNQNLLGEIAELDEPLYELIDLHKDNELALKRVLHCIYNLLQGNNKFNVKFGPKVFHKLIAVVIADSKDELCSPHGLRRQLVANVLICIQIHIRKFPRIDSKFLLRQLWNLSLNSERQPHAAQILVQLFDDFVRELGKECACSSELHTVIQGLLQSEVREYRRSAYFLMKKLLVIIQTEKDGAETSPRLLDSVRCTEQQWFAYVATMECLEEQQSHLVLPTLNTLLPRLLSNHLDEQWLTWLRILYARLLQDNNILVLRWTLTYFLSRFDLAKLCRVDLLPEFLAATNRSQLYNVESYFLPPFDMTRFMLQGELHVFLEALGTVPWHSVPLIFWLRNMQPENSIIVNKNVFLRLCSRIRTLKNPKLREIAIKRVYELFQATIDSLTLGEYMVFIETLFNISDRCYTDFNSLIVRIKNCENFGEHIVYFSKRCYEVIINEFGSNSQIENLVIEFIGKCSELPNAQHGWWRLFPLFYFLNRLNTDARLACLDFYRNKYHVNTEIFRKGISLAEVQEHLICKLNCQMKEEKSFVLEHCVDWFVQTHVESWSQIKELHAKPLDLLEGGTMATFEHLAKIRDDIGSEIEGSASELPTLIALLQKYQSYKSASVGIVKYAVSYLNDADNEKLVEIINSTRYGALVDAILNNAKFVPRCLVLQGILDGDASTGDARIEESYADSIICRFDHITIRNQYLGYINNRPDVEINEFYAELLRTNNKLTQRKPRYFENCREHRTKIRVARALLMIRHKIKWTDELWTALLAPNDQLNISYMYECLVAELLPNLEMLLKRMQELGTFKPSQQVSIISLVHVYCMRKWGELRLEDIKEIIGLLLPHTMGAHFQTRLLAQLIIHKLAVKCEGSSIDLPIAKALQSGIEMTLGSKLQELENESRLLLPAILHHDFPADLILFMTNAPFDEYDKHNTAFDKLKLQLEESRVSFKTRKNQIASATEISIETANSNVQRKMNPVNDIYHNDFLVGDDRKSTEQQLIVVASLIDKLPNLGGLARTCEVLGVKTLILSAKSFADKSDFTHLSMTAEKSLNIVEVKPSALNEFLIEKQSMGYKIVGAEQTAHSISFVDFKFPDKCVLLLGHEKHGIPVDLIALLDFAVEIPQFGLVRSLNVHVTGSLFIWEYCKQHLFK